MTPPLVNLVQPENGANYLLGQEVLAIWGADDDTSGLVQPVEATAEDGDLIDTATVGEKTFMITATDSAGNISMVTHNYEVVDGTPPSISASVTGTLGTNGWYTSDVVITWTIIDDESPVTSSTGCEVQTISTDTSGQTVTCEATSGGGTTSESVTIQKDMTPPIVNLVQPTNGATFTLGQEVLAMWTAEDATSGLVLPVTATIPSGEAFDTATIGTKTFMVTALDQAGNTMTLEHTYEVIPPTPTIKSLIAKVKNLRLPKEKKVSLIQKLRLAQKAVRADKPKLAYKKLQAFINQVKRLRGRVIPRPVAKHLITQARVIQASLVKN